MAIAETKEKNFEADIEAFFISPAGGYTKGNTAYDPACGLFKDTFIAFIKNTQPKAWKKFEFAYANNTEKKFISFFNDAVERDGILKVMRKGFKCGGIDFKACHFKPESTLNEDDITLYNGNVWHCYRQWFFSAKNNKSVDMVLVLNGIPLFAFELKNQLTGQDIRNSELQWRTDRDPRELCFRFNTRILAFFCVDLRQASMTTKLNGEKTFFLPFNQGSNGSGNDGGAGNPPNPKGYMTGYLWEKVFCRESMMDILQKFINLEITEDKKNGKKETKKTLVFPRYHQLDVVRKLVADVTENGAGQCYLIQHSAGSGKSNSIAWVAYRLATIFKKDNEPLFKSVIIVTDRRVLDKQLQNTVSGMDHVKGFIETIDESKHAKDLKTAINDGARIIVTTLQKFPVIYSEVEAAHGKNFAIICDEAHSSQTGTAAIKLKVALADDEEALKQYAELEEKSEDEIDKEDPILKELLKQGKHKNLSYFAFTATPKPKTLEIFGSEDKNGQFHPFHIYSMRQAIEEGFIMDVLQNYMTYKTCYAIANKTSDNPDVKGITAARIIKKYADLHPYNISSKVQIIIETFKDITSKAIGGKGKMMIVASSRLAAVRYLQEMRRYLNDMKQTSDAKDYENIGILVAFSGAVKDGGVEYTEPQLNVRKDGSHISEAQLRSDFHDDFNVLVVAEKYQTGFDEPLLHTMIVDKKLKGVKAVQTLSRLNRVCPGKKDTFILDFINTAEDIQNAFEPFYTETFLKEAINIDAIFEVQAKIANAGIYNEKDVEDFAEFYYSKSKQTNDDLGKIASMLEPVVRKYGELEETERYDFRRNVRNLVKWYNYISQINRLFNEKLHKEVIYANALSKFLSEDADPVIDIKNKLALEYYKLKEEFKGSISLAEGKGETSVGNKVGQVSDPTSLDPLNEVIKRINEQFGIDLTEADKVIYNSLHDKLMADKKFQKVVKSSKDDEEKIFVSSIFPNFFRDAANAGFDEQMEAYTSLFEDKNKYRAMMTILAAQLFKEIRQQTKTY